MFSNATIALLFSLGASAWIYSKMMRSTGGNVRSSLTVAGISVALLLVLTLIVLGLLF